MPILVSSIPDPTTTGRSRSPLYDQILDGRAWRLEMGVDFNDAPEHFRKRMRSAASKRGVSVQTRVRGKTVYVQASKPVQIPALLMEVQ